MNYNTKEITEKCISLIKENLRIKDYEIIIVDNDSNDGSIEFLKSRYNDIIYISNPQNYGFAKGNNIGARKSKGDILLILNSDAFIKENSIESMLNLINNNNDIDVIAPRLVDKDGNIQKSCFEKYSILFMFFQLTGLSFLLKFVAPRYFKNLFSKYYYEIQHPFSVSGACFMVRRNVFNEINGFDERYFFSTEEIDFFTRIRKNKNIVFYPKSEVIHIGGKSSKSMSIFNEYHLMLSNIMYFEKWHGKNASKIIFFLFMTRYFLKSFYNPTKYLKLLKAIFIDFDVLNLSIK